MRNTNNSRIVLIDSNGENLGKVEYQYAQTRAYDQGLDLVEINRTDDSTVFKIIDQGKWKYEQKKKKKSQSHHTPTTKEMKFGMRIESHDLEVKINHIKKFLDKNHMVRIVVEMRGRERKYPELAFEKMTDLLSQLGDIKQDGLKKTNTNVSVLIRSV